MAQGFIFGFGEDERCRIAKDFLSDPDAFLTAAGKTFGTIQCPQSCHDALARGQAAADDAEQIGPIDSAAKVSQLAAVAEQHFGADYETAYMPYGLQFREKIAITDEQPGTISGTFTITFLDKDADVDG